MKLTQLHGSDYVDGGKLRRFEHASFLSSHSAHFVLQRQFPDHVVLTDGDRFIIMNQDRTVRVAEFQMSGDLFGGFPF